MHSTRIGLVALTAIALTLTGCSASGADSGGDAHADVAAAQAGVAAFLDSPTAFPVTESLESLPTGARVAVLDCGSPICGLLADLAVAPAEALGMTTIRIESGSTADGVAAAFDTVLEGEFDGVFVPAIAPSLWERDLDELNAAGIPVVTTGVIGVDPNKVVVSGAAAPSSTIEGVLMADWVIAQDGDDTDVVFFTTPELPFSATVNEAFLGELEKLCPGCGARTVEIPIAQFGGGGAQIVVDDLLAHPDTTTAVFAIGEQAIGLPSALKAADLEVQTLLNGPDPSVLAGIQDGSFTAGVGVDLGVLTWTMIDSLARGITGQEVGDLVKKDQLVMQLLTADNLTGDVSHGWSGYPDFADRFAELWSQAT